MKKAKQTNTSKETILTESKTMREEYVKTEYFDVLDKIKAIPYMTKDMVVSIEQVATYYEVSYNSIKTVILRNREELEQDGITTIKGEELREFKNNLTLVHGESQSFVEKRTASLVLLTKRAMLRIGMLLTGSMIAKQVRNHLLNCEEEVSQEQQKWIAKREAAIIDRNRMTTAIKNYIPDSPNKKWKYPEYTNMVYKVIFNKDAKKMREERGFSKTDALRDSFTGEELFMIDEAETIVTALVTLGFSKEYIQSQLEKKFKPKENLL